MMSAKDKKKGSLVPRLRFPEFRDEGEWKEAKLNNICEVLPGYGFPEALQGKQSGQYPFCKVSDISKAISDDGGLLRTSVNYIDDADLSLLRAKVIPAGSTVFAKIGEALRLNRRVISAVECLIDNNAVGIKAKDTKSTDYFIYILSQRIDLNEYCGGAVPSVNKTTLENIDVLIPSIPEQQKIADCLSSLDERIAAETNKLDALKAHKKGLLKQLFPAEGETLPQLRFPEFQDAGEWNKTRLNNCVSIHAGLNVEQVNYPTDYKVTRIETISTQKIDNYKVGYIHPFQGMTAYKLNVGDILFSNINSIEHIGKSVFIDKDYGIYHGMNLLRLVATSQPRIAKFLFYYINTSSVRESFRRRANKAVNQASINQTELGKTVIYIPIYKKEQQRIADCLSSLDELIAAQTQKINLLKDHKKGLMQQLFPVLNEAQV